VKKNPAKQKINLVHNFYHYQIYQLDNDHFVISLRIKSLNQ